MKFLSKNPNSAIYRDGLMYKENSAENNKRLKELIAAEQKNFCAYTEKYLQELDSAELEHFDSKLKYSDNYFNYYTVVRYANLKKKDEKYTTIRPLFFESRFFQNPTELAKRLEFADGMFQEIDPTDQEVIDFIDFLDLNNAALAAQRNRHLTRLRNIFDMSSRNTKADKIAYFEQNREELNFITAIEAEFELDLAKFYS